MRRHGRRPDCYPFRPSDRPHKSLRIFEHPTLVRHLLNTNRQSIVLSRFGLSHLDAESMQHLDPEHLDLEHPDPRRRATIEIKVAVLVEKMRDSTALYPAPHMDPGQGQQVGIDTLDSATEEISQVSRLRTELLNMRILSRGQLRSDRLRLSRKTSRLKRLRIRAYEQCCLFSITTAQRQQLSSIKTYLKRLVQAFPWGPLIEQLAYYNIKLHIQPTGETPFRGQEMKNMLTGQDQSGQAEDGSQETQDQEDVDWIRYDAFIEFQVSPEVTGHDPDSEGTIKICVQRIAVRVDQGFGFLCEPGERGRLVGE